MNKLILTFLMCLISLGFSQKKVETDTLKARGAFKIRLSGTWYDRTSFFTYLNSSNKLIGSSGIQASSITNNEISNPNILMQAADGLFGGGNIFLGGNVLFQVNTKTPLSIVSDTVTVQANAITGIYIAGGAITTDKLALKAVTTEALDDSAVSWDKLKKAVKDSIRLGVEPGPPPDEVTIDTAGTGEFYLKDDAIRSPHIDNVFTNLVGLQIIDDDTWGVKTDGITIIVNANNELSVQDSSLMRTVLDTVDMKNIIPKENMVVNCLQNLVGGEFEFDPSIASFNHITTFSALGGGGWRRKEAEKKVFYPEWGGAKGDAVNDDSEELQAVFDAAGEFSGAIVHLGNGRTYSITKTLYLPFGIYIKGGIGAIAVENRPPEIRWNGSAGDTMIVTGTVAGNLQHMPIEGIYFAGGTNRPAFGIYYADRGDWETSLRRVQISGCDTAVYYHQGGINVHINSFRTDACKVSIYYRVTGIDNFSIEDFTCDNAIASQSVNGNFLTVDLTDAASSSSARFHLEDGKIEGNYNISNAGLFLTIKANPLDLGAKIPLRFVCTNIWDAWGAVNGSDIFSTPPSDSYFEFTNCEFAKGFSGIPSWEKHSHNIIQSGGFHSHTIISPHGNFNGLVATSERSGVLFTSDVLFNKGLYYGGQLITPFIYSEPDSTLFGNFPLQTIAGMMFYDAATGVLYRVTSGGTIGTLSGITGNGSSGSFYLHVNDSSKFKAGDVIVIGGTDTRKIYEHAGGDSLQLTAALSMTFTDANIKFSYPIFERNIIVKADSFEYQGSAPNDSLIFYKGSREYRIKGYAK